MANAKKGQEFGKMKHGNEKGLKYAEMRNDRICQAHLEMTGHWWQIIVGLVSVLGTRIIAALGKQIRVNRQLLQLRSRRSHVRLGHVAMTADSVGRICGNGEEENQCTEGTVVNKRRSVEET
jgi:hypothetical protein